MQVYLFQEREHVLRLYAENDRLKVMVYLHQVNAKATFLGIWYSIVLFTPSEIEIDITFSENQTGPVPKRVMEKVMSVSFLHCVSRP